MAASRTLPNDGVVNVPSNDHPAMHTIPPPSYNEATQRRVAALAPGLTLRWVRSGIQEEIAEDGEDSDQEADTEDSTQQRIVLDATLAIEGNNNHIFYPITPLISGITHAFAAQRQQQQQAAAQATGLINSMETALDPGHITINCSMSIRGSGNVVSRGYTSPLGSPPLFSRVNARPSSASSPVSVGADRLAPTTTAIAAGSTADQPPVAVHHSMVSQLASSVAQHTEPEPSEGSDAGDTACGATTAGAAMNLPPTPISPVQTPVSDDAEQTETTAESAMASASPRGFKRCHASSAPAPICASCGHSVEASAIPTEHSPGHRSDRGSRAAKRSRSNK